MYVYVYRNASHCPIVWAEIDKGLPVHPSELLARMEDFIAKRVSFGTQSDLVIHILMWRIRVKKLYDITKVVYVDAERQPTILDLDIKGDFIQPWPEDGFNSILEAKFHYLFDKGT